MMRATEKAARYVGSIPEYVKTGNEAMLGWGLPINMLDTTSRIFAD
jgi:hypothetical protein